MSALPPLLEMQHSLSLRGISVTLRVPSGAALLEAQREAESLSPSDAGRALAANACLLAKALYRDGEALFSSGEAVLSALSSGEIGRLAAELGSLELLCPACRERLFGGQCRRCGAALSSFGENPAFDQSRFEALAREGSR